MKKVFTLLTMLVFTGFIYAQSLLPVDNNPHKTVKYNIHVLKNNMPYQGKAMNYFKNNNKSGATTATQWFSYAKQWEDSLYPNGGATNLYADYMFPDTLVKVQYSNGLFADDTHAISTLLDPTAIPVFNSMKFDKTKPYSVDSIAIFDVYTRNINNKIGDTLIIDLLTGYEAPAYFFSGAGIQTGFGVDTLYFGGIDFNTKTLEIDTAVLDPIYTKLQLPKPMLYTYKYVLTAKDTAKISGANYSYVEIATPGAATNPNTGFLACSVHFKPGYSYTNGTLMSAVNGFEFLSFDENGTNTYPTYIGRNDWNCSYIAPTWDIWPTTAVDSSWSGIYVPEWAYDDTYPYDNHYMLFQLTYSVTGIVENSAKTVKLSQNIPNPAENLTQINYELKNINHNVSLVITDMTGREIMNINEGTQMQGNHSINLNTSSLSSGMYYYTLYADNTKLTRKMIVTK